MKILILGSFANHLLLFRDALMQTMRQKGHDVVACVPDASSEIQGKLATMGIHYHNIVMRRTGMNPIEDFQTLLNLWATFRRVQPDVLLGYTIKPVIYGSLAGRLARVPRIYSMITGLGYAFTETDTKSRWVNRIVKLLYRVSLRYPHKIFFQNPDDLKFFKNSQFILEEQAVVINGSGIDLESFKPVPFPEKISFLLIARLINAKGIREYVNAARLLKHTYPSITFRLAGWIDYDNPTSVSEEELHSWVKQGIIEYSGKLSDVRPTIAASSVYVLPSYYREGTPRSVLEAMAMGRPIITTDAPGCRETVQPGENGFLVPIKDVPALAVAMEQFIHHPELINPMGEASRRMAVEKYDVHKVNAVILETMGL